MPTFPARRVADLARGLAWRLACVVALACGGESVPPAGTTYALGGTAEGLAGTLILRNQNVDILPLHSNGSFTFARPLADGEAYRVEIAVQPSLQSCALGSASGTVRAASATDITVSCSARTFALGGRLAASVAPIVVHNNGQDALTLSAPGAFAFGQGLPAGAHYQVTADAPGQICTLSGDVGAMGAQDALGVAIGCQPLGYSLGGTLTGLPAGGQLRLAAAGQQVTLAANGNFVFPAPALFTTPVDASVLQAPANSRCQVVAAHPQVVAGDNLTLQVACQAVPRTAFSVGGSIAGARAPVTLIDASLGSQVFPGNGAFTFSGALASGAAYAVTVAASPPGQSCQVTGGTGTVAGADALGLAVGCSDLPYTVGGTVTGLAAGKSVTLVNGGDSLVVAQNGPFALAAPVLNAQPFAVAVGAQPVGELCSVAGGSGSISAASQLGIGVACRPILRLVSGQSASLAVGQTGLALSLFRPPAATSLGRPVGVWPRPGGALYVADAIFGHASGFLSRPAASGAAADFVVDRGYPGATDFQATTQWAPQGLAGDAATLAMADGHNNRVLLWRPAPVASAAPTLAVGQSSVNGTAGGCSASQLSSPGGIALANGLLAVADAGNHRVLIWRSVASSGQAADLVLGQPDFASCSAQPVGPTSLSSPGGVWTDGTLLLVSDTASSRVLWWRNIGLAHNGAPADGVLGQADFVTATPNPDPRRQLAAPAGVASAYGQVWVVDTQLSRVMGYSQLPADSAVPANPAADLVLGAKGFTNLAGCNLGGIDNDDQPVDISLCDPTGVAVDGERLWVADANNHRLVAYDSF